MTPPWADLLPAVWSTCILCVEYSVKRSLNACHATGSWDSGRTVANITGPPVPMGHVGIVLHQLYWCACATGIELMLAK